MSGNAGRLHVRGASAGRVPDEDLIMLFTVSGHGRAPLQAPHPLVRAAPARREPLRAHGRPGPRGPPPIAWGKQLTATSCSLVTDQVCTIRPSLVQSSKTSAGTHVTIRYG